MVTQNAYGQGPVSRLLTPLRGLVRPGNSGGPLVDVDGRVLTTVFAATVDSQRARRLRRGQRNGGERAARSDAHEREGAQVSTGPCTSG